jgi:peptidoglycan/xylan/chitin deacetylase (PgdA/CDA1 family)
MTLSNLAKWGVAVIGAGLNRTMGSLDSGRVGILAYHRIAPPVAGLPAPTLNVPPVRFREQLVGLLERGFQVWPLREVLRCAAQQRSVPPRTIVLTFDDAYESTYLHAWPVLEALRLPATVFLSTSYLDSDDPFPFDPWGMAHARRAPATMYCPLRASQCREMMASGLIDLGAHTHTHQDFRGRPAEFQRDVQISVDVLRSSFGVRDVTFAFPYGRPAHGTAGDGLEAAARRTGVICGLTTENVLVNVDGDPFRWGRFSAYAWDSAELLAAKLGGWYGWAPRLQERTARRLSALGKHARQGALLPSASRGTR